MTRKGEGKRALYFSVIASGIGSFIGLIVLLFFAPVLSSISVRFGPPEMMLLAICGLTIVGSLTGKNVPKGLLAALAGLFPVSYTHLIPACVSMYIEALADGGVANGLPRDFALREMCIRDRYGTGRLPSVQWTQAGH